MAKSFLAIIGAAACAGGANAQPAALPSGAWAGAAQFGRVGSSDIWLYGAKDRTVPSRLCIERLDPLTREPSRDFSYVNFPGGTHGLIKTESGLLPGGAALEPDRRRPLADGSGLAPRARLLNLLLASFRTIQA